MKRKLKNTVRESFSFPETAHKDEFFRQLEGSPVIQKKSPSRIPALVRFTAVAAAAAFCLGVCRSLDLDPALYKNGSQSEIIAETTAAPDDAAIPSATTHTGYHNSPEAAATAEADNSGGSIIVTAAVNSSLSITETTAASAPQKETVTITTPAWSDNAAAATTAAAPQNPPCGTGDPAYSATTPAPPVTTDIPDIPDTPDTNDERSIYMKKFTAFTSAVTVLAANSSLNVFAEYQPPEIEPDVQAAIDYIDSNAPDLDFNCDGEFNARDLYCFDSYFSRGLLMTDESSAKCAQDGDINKDGVIDFGDWNAIHKYADSIGDAADTELDFNCDGYFLPGLDDFALYDYIYVNTVYTDDHIAKINANGDVNCDGTVDGSDTRCLRAYYVIKELFTAEEFNEDYYRIEGVPGVSAEGSMVYRLKAAISDYDKSYQMITGMVENGDLSLDFNLDGNANIIDAFDYYSYCFENDSFDIYEEYAEQGDGSISRDVWESCAYFNSMRPDGYGFESTGVGNDYDAVIKYFLYHSEITEEMLRSDMYAAHREKGSDSFVLYLKNMAENEGVIPADGTTLNDALFWEYYDKCEAEFNSGERALPDADLNGVIDYEDYYAANIFFSDHHTGVSCEDSILPADVWNNFNENCDFNGNGISGDVYDTTIVNIYVLKHAEEEPEDFDAAYQAYIAELTAAKGSSYEIKAALTADEVKTLLDSEEQPVTATVWGDADCDGVVTINDVVAVMSYTTYFDAEISEQGRFNADVYQHGDGLSNMDALTIQNSVAQLVSELPESYMS